MSIIWHTKKINVQNYYKIIRRTVIFNSSHAYWNQFKKDWTVHVFPADDIDKYKHFFAHIPNINVSRNMAWGITGQKEMFLFINDSRNPFIIRSNTMPIGHELLHAIYQDNVGTFHIKRHYDAPDGNAGSRAPAATVIVHDNWYGTNVTLTYWISWGLGWIPLKTPYIPLKVAKQIYPI